MKIFAIELEEVDSTNSYAMHHFATFPPSLLTVVTAKKQSAGRGRYARRWLSTPGASLTATYCLFVDPLKSSPANIAQLLALSAVEIIEEMGVAAEIKWPNDIVAGGKKLGGILTETKSSGDRLFLAAGIGINVNMDKELFSFVDQPATSLLIESGSRADVDSLQLLLLERFRDKLQLFLARGFSPFVDAFRRVLYTPSPMRFTHGGITTAGTFHTLHDDGTLSLILESGEIKRFSYGEIL